MSHLLNTVAPVVGLGAGAGLLGLVYVAMGRIDRMRPPKQGKAKTAMSVAKPIQRSRGR